MTQERSGDVGEEILKEFAVAVSARRTVVTADLGKTSFTVDGALTLSTVSARDQRRAIELAKERTEEDYPDSDGWQLTAAALEISDSPGKEVGDSDTT